MKKILRAGADKVSLNTAAVTRPELINEGSDFFGAQCIVVAIDAKYDEELGSWRVYTHGGRTPTEWEVIALGEGSRSTRCRGNFINEYGSMMARRRL